jgi:hypothetical protein
MIDNPLIWLLIAVAAVVLIGLFVHSFRASGEKKPIVPQVDPLAASAAPVRTGSSPPPYGIDRRPMPTGNDPEQLLPATVGPFRRDSVAGQDPGGPIYANYAAGRRAVFVELGICGEPGAARRALATAKAETDAEFPDIPQQASLDTEPAFLKTTTRLGAFMAWTRGGYYFSAHARGGDDDLDEFLKSFPY